MFAVCPLCAGNSEMNKKHVTHLHASMFILLKDLTSPVSLTSTLRSLGGGGVTENNFVYVVTPEGFSEGPIMLRKETTKINV